MTVHNIMSIVKGNGLKKNSAIKNVCVSASACVCKISVDRETSDPAEISLNIYIYILEQVEEQ